MNDDLTEAEESLWADAAWEFIQEQAIRGIPCMVIRCGPGAPHLCIGKSQLYTAPKVLRECADIVEAEYGTYPGPFN